MQGNLRKWGLLAVFFFFLIFLQMCNTVGFCQISFTVVPLVQEITVPPGATRDFRLRIITGPGEKRDMHFLVYPVDFRLGKDGQIQFLRAGSIKRSAARWIKTAPAEFTMKPNQTKDINIELTIPPNISGGYYAAILAHLLPTVPPGMRIGTVRTWRMASLVELTVAGWRKPRARIRIAELNVEPGSEGKGLTFSATVENKGNVHVRGEGTLTVMTREGRRLAQLPLKAGRGTIFPDSMRDFEVVLERELGPGDYFADVAFRYGNRGVREKFSFSVGGAPIEGEALVQKKETSFFVTPPKVEVKAPSGSVRTMNFLITSQEKERVHFRLYLKDIDMDSDGNIALLDKGSTLWSASNWVKLKESEFELDQGQGKNILGFLNIPKDATGGRYARLVVEASPVRAKTDEKITTLVPETIIMVTAGDKLERKGEISKFQFLQSNGGPPEFLVLFKNTGNVHLMVKGVITLKDLSGNTMAGLPFSGGEVLVLPGGSRRFTASSSESLQAGEYEAEVTFLSQNEVVVSTVEDVVVTD